MLSGGAHPVLPHDDHLVQGLINAGTKDVPVSLTSARNYCCDGCYEPLFPGETDFSLATVSLLQVLEMTINHGSTYSRAGSGFLEGTPQSLSTKHPEEIGDFEEVSGDNLLQVFLDFWGVGGGGVGSPHLRHRYCGTLS